MAKNYWMVVLTPENFKISKELGFTVHGLGRKYRKRVERMELDDLMLFYVSGLRKWAVTASIKSKKYEDHSPIWRAGRDGDKLPYRVKLSPNIVLEEEDYIDAGEVGPRLEYIKRWEPERWPLAFFDALHLLPQRDYRLIEGEMKRIQRRRRGGNRRRRDRRGEQSPGQEAREVVPTGVGMPTGADGASANSQDGQPQDGPTPGEPDRVDQPVPDYEQAPQPMQPHPDQGSEEAAGG